jgi:myo-inositol catabolism protein IolS
MRLASACPFLLGEERLEAPPGRLTWNGDGTHTSADVACRWSARSAAHEREGDAMEYRRFGQTDLRVSSIGFGCWEISGTYGQIDETHFARAVHRAIDGGINCFDTAEAYGMGISERALAKALGARRKDVTVVTKGGVGYADAPNRRDSTCRRLTASLDTSLKNLGTDHVDVYLVHWPDVNTSFEETMRTLDDVVRQGKTRYVGVSNFRLTQLETCMALRRIDVVQYGWNMFDRRMNREIFPWCLANRVGVMAYGSLAYGLLSGTFRADMTFDETDWRARRGALGSLNLFRTMFGVDHFARNLAAVEELRRIATRHGKTLPQLALCWTMGNAVISTSLVGFRRPEEVEENLGALGWKLSPEELTEIDAIFARHDAVTEPEGWLEDDPPATTR